MTNMSEQTPISAIHSKHGLRRLPTIYDVRESYHRYGMHLSAERDVPAMYRYADAFQRSVGKEALKDYYGAWVQYELGLAKQSGNPTGAFTHYLRSGGLMERYAAKQPNELRRIAEKDILLTRLLAARLEPNERQHRLQQRGTARALGAFAIHSLDSIRRSDPMSKEHRSVRGTVMEALMAGTLLTLDTNGMAFIPAPATPRQDCPHTEQRLRYADTIAGLQTIKSYDFNLHCYDGDSAEALAVIPTQIKSFEFNTTDQYRYDPSVLVLFGSRDLFIESPIEMRSFAQMLQTYNRLDTPAAGLQIAQSNLELAIELHAERGIPAAYRESVS